MNRSTLRNGEDNVHAQKNLLCSSDRAVKMYTSWYLTCSEEGLLCLTFENAPVNDGNVAATMSVEVNLQPSGQNTKVENRSLLYCSVIMGEALSMQNFYYEFNKNYAVYNC